MSNLQIHLFREEPTAVVDGEALQLRPLGRAILALLVAEGQRALSTRTLLDLLMPKTGDLEKLRETLHRAKSELKPLLARNPTTVELLPEVWVDMQAFQGQFADVDFLYHGDPRYIETLEAIWSLYGEGFLTAYDLQGDLRYDLANSEAEMQLDRLRTQFRNLIDKVLEYRLIYYVNNLQYVEAIRVANEWLNLDVTDERAHLWLVRAHALNREPEAALRFGRQLQQRLKLQDPLNPYLEDLNSLLEKIDTNQPLHQIYPRLPNPLTFMGRDEDIRALKERLGIRGQRVSRQVVGVVSGWPGVGKTAMVRVLANDPQVRGHFCDGVFAVSVGEGMLALDALQQVGQQMGLPVFKSTDAGVERLQDALAERRALLLIDDVYVVEQVEPFRQIVGGDNALLVTTRFADVVGAFDDTQHYRLNVLDAREARNLLLLLSPDMRRGYEAQAAALVEALEYLPLALLVAARMLNERFKMLYQGRLEAEELDGFFQEMQEVYALLREKDPEERVDPTTGLTATLTFLLEQSVRQLPTEYRRYFARLGIVRAKPARVTRKDLEDLWQRENIVPILTTFLDKGLLESVSERAYQIHTLLRAYARTLLRGA